MAIDTPKAFLTRLCQLKKDPVQIDGAFAVLTATPAISAYWQHEENGLYGVFNVGGVINTMRTPLPDGSYIDVLTDSPVAVRDGEIALPESAVIVRYQGELDPETHLQRPFTL
jgi:hypothetical protein